MADPPSPWGTATTSYVTFPQLHAAPAAGGLLRPRLSEVRTFAR